MHCRVGRRNGIMLEENWCITIDDNNVNQALLENKEIINLSNWMRRFTYNMIYIIAIGNHLTQIQNYLCGLNDHETESSSIIKSIQEGIMYFRLFQNTFVIIFHINEKLFVDI
ncbi:24524_t:CDS:1 [Gigaspora rosea]|nr:24524_t:CDS:1 [Gigaspora rosea]